MKRVGQDRLAESRDENTIDASEIFATRNVKLTGGALNDTLTGRIQKDISYGLAGKDTLSGNAGDRVPIFT